MASIELLIGKPPSERAKPLLQAFERAARASGDVVMRTGSYRGRSEWLVCFGIGHHSHAAARKRQLQAGRRTLHFDLGYTQRARVGGAFRMCIDDDHPQAWLDQTPESGRSLGLTLTDTYDADGPIILVGLGKKARAYMKTQEWEREAYAELAARFTGRDIWYRPKDAEDPVTLPCARKAEGQFSELLQGAALVVAHHSNCCVDAIAHRVPFEAQDGAAVWLKNLDDRERFLNKLAWWQWKANEMDQAWNFAKAVANAKT